MLSAQPSILSALPPHGRFLTFGLAHGFDASEALRRLSRLSAGEPRVIGLGDPLLRAAGHPLALLRPFPALSGPAGAFPSTQGALWAFLRGDDPGELLLRARKLTEEVGPSFRIEEDVASYVYAGGRDLSGYEDGTENPKDEKAVAAAICASEVPGLGGSSFVATQRWVHELARMEAMTQQQRDHVIGRFRESNEEIADAPPSAHVKRSAQESFEPAAFMVRRSMPWGDLREHGLYFVAYGATLDPFERVLRRMAGLDDGIPDALLRFTRPVTGGYFWCPPVREGRLDLRAVSL